MGKKKKAVTQAIKSKAEGRVKVEASAAPAEGQDAVPNSHTVAHNWPCSISRGSDTLIDFMGTRHVVHR